MKIPVFESLLHEVGGLKPSLDEWFCDYKFVSKLSKATFCYCKIFYYKNFLPLFSEKLLERTRYIGKIGSRTSEPGPWSSTPDSSAESRITDPWGGRRILDSWSGSKSSDRMVRSVTNNCRDKICFHWKLSIQFFLI